LLDDGLGVVVVVLVEDVPAGVVVVVVSVVVLCLQPAIPKTTTVKSISNFLPITHSLKKLMLTKVDTKKTASV
jgi:hypothetical protein